MGKGTFGLGILEVQEVGIEGRNETCRTKVVSQCDHATRAKTEKKKYAAKRPQEYWESPRCMEV